MACPSAMQGARSGWPLASSSVQHGSRSARDCLSQRPLCPHGQHAFESSFRIDRPAQDCSRTRAAATYTFPAAIDASVSLNTHVMQFAGRQAPLPRISRHCCLRCADRKARAVARSRNATRGLFCMNYDHVYKENPAHPEHDCKAVQVQLLVNRLSLEHFRALVCW